MNANQRTNRRLRLFTQQRGMCCWCGLTMRMDTSESHPDFATFEHIIPQKHGGTDSIANLLLAHKKCNQERSSDRSRIPLFCWARRELGSDALKIVKYLDNKDTPLPGPKALSLHPYAT